METTSYTRYSRPVRVPALPTPLYRKTVLALFLLNAMLYVAIVGIS